MITTMAEAAAEPVFPDYGPKYLTPTEEVVTPHIKWVKPDAQGPLKVLFIVWRGGMREVIELAQRMDLQYTVFASGGSTVKRDKHDPSGFSSNFRYDPAIARDKETLANDLAAKLEGSYDLIMLGNIDWSSFPITLRYKLLRKAKDGTPLLGFISNPDTYLSRATAKKKKADLAALVPFKGLAAFAGYKDAPAWIDATIDYSVFGKGRILLLKGYKVPSLQAFTPAPAGNLLETNLVEYDYYMAWIGHLMRFMAGRTSTVKVIGRDYIASHRAGLGNIEYAVSGPDGKPATCVFAFRNEDNQIIVRQEKNIKLASEGSRVILEVPQLPSGRYFSDIWVKDGDKILTYGSSFVELIGAPAIEAIEIKTDYRREDKVTGKIKIVARKERAEGFAPAEDGINLLLRQRDTYGRMTAQARLDIPLVQAPAAREVDFELAGSPPLAIVQYLEVDLRKGNEVLDSAKKAFSISDLPPKNDIRMIAFCQNVAAAYPLYYMFAELARMGFDTQYFNFTEITARSNIRHIPYAVRLAYFPTKNSIHATDDHVRKPCLLDPSYRKKLNEALTQRAEQCRPYSTTEVSMGDECHFVVGDYELCFCAHCVSAFHQVLANEYGTVEAMNREYGTQYKAFNEVQPITLNKAKKETMLQPLWVDFRRHMETTWAGAYSSGGDVVKKVLPSAKIGYEGSDVRINSYKAADHYKIMKAMRFNNTYDGAFVPYAAMSFAQPGTLLGLGWYGGYNFHRCPEFQRYIAWRHLFRGANSYWIFTAHAADFGSQSIMAPDMSLYDFSKANIAELREIKNGIGKLMMTARRADDGIAILYSASSIHAATLTEGLPQMSAVLNALIPLFEDGGRQFQLLAYEQVANGELKTGKFRLLWMPYTQALSRKEAVEIETFVREGGTAVADLRPGVRDEHGKPYEGGGILDKVFGVKQMTAKPTPTNCIASINLDGCPKTLRKADCDVSVELGTGEARASLAGGKPAMIINRYGKGKAILLNFSLSAYAGVKGDLESSAVKIGDSSLEIMAIFKALMAQSGIEAPVKVEPEMAGVRFYRFAKDAVAYLGVLQELPEPPKAYTLGDARPLVARSGELSLLEKRHIYNSREGKYLGFTDRIKTVIEPAKGMLFALLPYEVKGIKLSAPERIGQGEALKYEAAVDGVERFGLHVFHVELVSPRGKTVSYYAENVIAEKGRGKGSFHLALNEMTGEWKIRVKDAATGMTLEQMFAVEERK